MLENAGVSDGLELATSGVTGDQRGKQHQPLFRMSIAAWLPEQA
jgi:hypothetical protein